MPAFLDIIAGQGWVRGCLPVLNRVAQSIPPLLLADSIRRKPLKRKFVFTTTFLMAIPFLILAIIWGVMDGKNFTGFAALFLFLYTIFFVFSGLQQSGIATLQGKLVPVTKRGRLMGVAGVIGSIMAVGCALAFMGKWLELPNGGYHLIFGFTGVGFLISSFAIAGANERPDIAEESSRPKTNVFKRAWSLFLKDHAFRKVAIVSMLLMSTQLLFPHYQALANVRFSDFDKRHLMIWVVCQNVGVGVVSVFSGWVADKFGNRLAIRFATVFTTLVPILALAMSAGPYKSSSISFSAVFVGIAWVPVSMRLFTNYILEISDSENHPFYVGSLKVCFAVPFILSPFVGVMVDLTGFDGVFIGIAALSLFGLIGTFRMVEPRQG